MQQRVRGARLQKAIPAALSASPPRRVLVASHGHPAITRGGAENAAYALFQALDQSPTYEAWFLGCRPDSRGSHLGVSITQPFGEREFVYTPGEFDWFKFANRDPSFPPEFKKLLEEVKPDIIHFHHFAFFGLEVFWFAKKVLPDVKIILTVHEFLLICNAYGQMVTKQKQFLCYQATLDSCHACFPEFSRADFFLRRHYATLFLPSLDAVIAPSTFLAARLRAWGMTTPRIDVIENCVPVRTEQPAILPETAVQTQFRVGFFGQISRLKGIGVLLEAAKILAGSGDRLVSVDIHGKYEGQPPEFQAEFLEQLAEAGSNVRYHGPYLPRQVDELMQTVAVVIIPSIWWENSPVVIQEAFRNRRPIICSNIGGMAEKVRDGIDGWHIRVGDAQGLALLLAYLAVERQQVTAMTGTVRSPAAASETLAAHKQLYDEVCGGLLTGRQSG